MQQHAMNWRFVRRFELNIETEGVHLDLLEDELANTYRTHHTLSEGQIEVNMLKYLLPHFHECQLNIPHSTPTTMHLLPIWRPMQ